MPRKIFPANVVGPQIRQKRRQLELTQEQLATRCQLAGLDISRSTLAQIESRFRYVADEELFIIAEVLGISPDQLFPQDFKRRRKKSPHRRK